MLAITEMVNLPGAMGIVKMMKERDQQQRQAVSHQHRLPLENITNSPPAKAGRSILNIIDMFLDSGKTLFSRHCRRKIVYNPCP